MRIRDIMRSLDLEVQSTFLLLNRCDGNLSPGLMAEFTKTGLEIIGYVPSDPAIAQFEEEQKSLLELPADSMALRVIEKTVDEILKRRNK